MKFQLEKKDLMEALKSVQPAVASRSSLPILGGIKLEATGGKLTVEATDLELAIRLDMTAEISGESGRAVVPAKTFAKAVKAIPDATVTIEIHDSDDRKAVDVCCTKRKVAIEGFSPDDWPDIAQDSEWKPLCHVEASDLADVLGRVASCASRDDSRPVITGVQFNLKDGETKAEVVATDSYRLGLASLDVEMVGEAPECSPILPARVLLALAKELKRHSGRAVLHLGTAGQPEHQRILAQLSFGTISWVMRTIEGEFPNWKALVPNDSQGSAFEFDSKELVSAVKGAAELRDQKTVPVRFALGDSCVLRMVEGQTEKVVETLDSATYSPNGVGRLEIAFSPDFLISGISFIGAGKGLMRMTDGHKPVLLIGDAEDRYVLMPVRLP